MFRRWKGPPFAPRKSSQAKKTGRKKIKKGEGNSPPLLHSSLLRAAAPPDDIFFFPLFVAFSPLSLAHRCSRPSPLRAGLLLPAARSGRGSSSGSRSVPSSLPEPM